MERRIQRLAVDLPRALDGGQINGDNGSRTFIFSKKLFEKS